MSNRRTVTLESTSYGGWNHCYRLTNGIVELVITGDVGPRIIRFGFVGGSNEFREYPDLLGKTGGEEWRIYGGHRLWHAPEGVPRTYFPDNGPVQIVEQSGLVRVIQLPEASTGIQKEIDVLLDPLRPAVRLVHRLRNCGVGKVELAPWALSVMSPGGRAVMPLPPRGRHPDALSPCSSLTLWPYTDMTDPRWTWGSKYVLLRQDPSMTSPQKVGAFAPDGWVAYARDGHLFVKAFDCKPGERYPDLGACAEAFTNAEMLELETLGPLVSLAPDELVEHVEDWFLFADVPVPQSETDVDQYIVPLVSGATCRRRSSLYSVSP